MIKKFSFFSILTLVCLCISMSSIVKAEEQNPIEVTISTSTTNPSQDELNNLNLSGLKFKGSILLTCMHPAFGGFSELMISPDGKNFLSVSDMGFWITGNIQYDKNGWISGIDQPAKLGRLLNIEGKPFQIKYRSDSEAFCRAPDSGFLVAFERKHRINHYPGDRFDLSGVPVRYEFPPNFSNLPVNGGIESMMRLDDKRILMITEGDPEDGGVSPCAIGTAGNWEAFNYKRSGTYRPTSIAKILGNKILILERSYTGPGSLRIRLATIAMKDIKDGATIQSKYLLELPRPLPIDNYEGLDTITTEDGKTLIYIISDDNFNPLQHTLMMMFELDTK